MIKRQICLMSPGTPYVYTGVWLLETGVWNNSGIWRNDATWNI